MKFLAKYNAKNGTQCACYFDRENNIYSLSTGIGKSCHRPFNSVEDVERFIKGLPNAPVSRKRKRKKKRSTTHPSTIPQ